MSEPPPAFGFTTNLSATSEAASDRLLLAIAPLKILVPMLQTSAKSPVVAPRTEHSLLHIRIVKPAPDGEVVVLGESKPTKGGSHITLIFSELDELLGCGFTPENLLGAVAETYVDGKLDGSGIIRESDLRIINERRARLIK